MIPSSASLRKRNLTRELKRILPRIIQGYRPSKIILFGSLVTGQVTESSDIDLAIVKATKKRFLDRVGDILSIADPKFSMDALVYTPREWSQMIKENRYFVKEEILKRGKVLYERKQPLV
ncbi:MAG: nucleotidyltransferase domain-containing protein [Chlamydiae bacterium]|nr:nucleotidyltransferase domain-containing protein [Chlamydiota bacterium]MBI3277491.1 nucleotidyltransferase domain-containing protein [Chlamydiota bacterium]